MGDFAGDRGWHAIEYAETLAMTGGRQRHSVADARNLAEGALRGIGYRDEEARIIGAECRWRSLLTATDEIA